MCSSFTITWTVWHIDSLDVDFQTVLNIFTYFTGEEMLWYVLWYFIEKGYRDKFVEHNTT